MAGTRADYDRLRARVKPSRQWYNSRKWRAKAKHQLSAQPMCRYCWEREGAAVKATVADHRIPHREDFDLFWGGELDSLCATCHSSTKQREERVR